SGRPRYAALFRLDIGNAFAVTPNRVPDVLKAAGAPLHDRIRFFHDSEEFLPGVRAIAAPGHTPGHTMFLISSAGEELCVLCDVTFHDPLSYAFPESESAYDYDKVRGVRTRVERLTWLAQSRMRVISYHAQWPGIGHVARAGAAFRYVPAPMLARVN